LTVEDGLEGLLTRQSGDRDVGCDHSVGTISTQ
jgi:hypothetical protein